MAARLLQLQTADGAGSSPPALYRRGRGCPPWGQEGTRVDQARPDVRHLMSSWPCSFLAAAIRTTLTQGGLGGACGTATCR